MKFLLPILALCFLPLIFGAHLKKAANKPNCCVIVYANRNYKGASHEFCGNQGSLGSWNGKASSYKSNCNPTLYSEPSGRGYILSGSSNADLTKECIYNGNGGFFDGQTVCKATWNDKISSIYFF